MPSTALNTERNLLQTEVCCSHWRQYSSDGLAQ